MTEEQIDRIAREYANEYYSVRGGAELMTDEARNVIEFILRDHLIVEKSKVMELWHKFENDSFIAARANDNEYLDKCNFAKEMLDALFGEETFNQEKQ